MKRLFIIIAALTLIIAVYQTPRITARAAEYEITETISYVPAFIGTSFEVKDDRQYLIRTYEGKPGYDADIEKMIEEPFEYEGYFYAFNNLTTNEVMTEEAKWERTEVSFPIDVDDLQAVYQRLQPKIPYIGEDGYRGTLDLDYTAVWTQVDGYMSRTHTMTDTVTISGLSSNDTSNIAKTRVKSGITMQLKSVDWTVQESTNIGYDTVPTKYTAVAHYSGNYTNQAPAGYLARALYGGVVTKARVDKVLYDIAYVGEPLALAPTAEQESVHDNRQENNTDENVSDGTEEGEHQNINPNTKKSRTAWVITTTAIFLALVGLAVAAYFYFFNVIVYTSEGDEDYRVIARRYMRVSNPVVDLRKLNFTGNELIILVKKRIASELHRQTIETIVRDDYTHRCCVNKRNSDFTYTILFPGAKGYPAGRGDVSELDDGDSSED